jgi:magnesium transporter
MKDEFQKLINEHNWNTLAKLLISLDPSDIADVIKECSTEDSFNILNSMTVEKAAAVFEYLPFESQEELMAILSSGDLSLLLDRMSSDDRTRLLEQLTPDLLKRVMRILNPEASKVTGLLLSYDENSVGRYMNKDYFCVKAGMTVNEAIDYLRSYTKTSKSPIINMVYVVDEKGKFVNEINMATLVISPPETKVREMQDHVLITLLDTSDIEEAVNIFEKYSRFTLPVIDRMGVLTGILTGDDILDISMEEATEDIQKLGGMEGLDAAYFDIGIAGMLRKRGGWLSVLFIGEMLTATAMSYFEYEISKAVVLALFIPLIISSGGNSGSQATSLIIRSLALGEVKLKDWWQVCRRELLTGLLLGSLLGMIGAFRILIWPTRVSLYGPHYLLIAMTISFSLVGVVAFGTISGSMLPFILRRVGFDPASASAPFVATLVDVTGLVIYFTIASIILKGVLL